jgi:hypothetical protein
VALPLEHFIRAEKEDSRKRELCDRGRARAECGHVKACSAKCWEGWYFDS